MTKGKDRNKDRFKKEKL